MRKFRGLVLILICFCILTLTSCKTEAVFRDYTETESYNSSAVTIDTTQLSEIITEKYGAQLIDYNPIVDAGENTSITLKLDNNTKYKIEVEYSSGVSKSNALRPKISDQNGYITWHWQVGTKCKAGKYPVRIYKDSDIVFETRLIIN